MSYDVWSSSCVFRHKFSSSFFPMSFGHSKEASPEKCFKYSQHMLFLVPRIYNGLFEYQ